MEQESLATELLHMVKMSARRWFIAFLVMVGVEIGTVAGFMWYISRPTEEETAISQEMEDVDDSKATQIIGGDYNGENETNQKNLQEESNEK